MLPMQAPSLWRSVFIVTLLDTNESLPFGVQDNDTGNEFSGYVRLQHIDDQYSRRH